MGFLSGIFDSGSQEQKQNIEYPKWVTQTGERAGERAQKIAEQPYTAYQGPRVAGQSDNTQSAYDLARGSYKAPARMVRAGFRTASNVAQQRWNAPTAQRYMNPYMRHVVKRINEQAEKNAIGTRAGQISGGGIGAFGDARTAVLEGELERGRLDAVGGAYGQAYESGRRAFEDEQNRRLRASDVQGVQGGRMGAVTSQAISDMGRTGAIDEAREQRSLDVAHQDFLEQRNWLERGLDAYLKALGGSPGRTGATADVATPSVAQQGVGLGVTGASLWNMFFR